MTQSKLMPWLKAILFVFATINGFQFYILITHPLLDMQRYYAGTERLPFQERLLPIPILKLLDHISASVHFFHSGNGVFSQALFGPFVLSIVSFFIASIFVVLLYRASSHRQSLGGTLVATIFLILTLATYVVRTWTNLYYPYDMPSLMFFSAGLYFIYKRSFLPLLLVVLIGTFNRETTFFLIVIYVLDAMAEPLQSAADATIRNLNWRCIPWLRAGCLTVILLAIKIALRHRFAGNDRSEEFNRFWGTLHGISPKFWPTILNMCGYALPIVWVLRRKLPSARLAAWLLVVPLWIFAMFFVGVITETRIYGELIPLVSIAVVLLLEESLAQGTPAKVNIPSGF